MDLVDVQFKKNNVATSEPSKSTLDNVLQSILSTVNKEANQDFPPSVFSSLFNTITGFLITELSKQYPKNQEVCDILDVFINTAMIPATGGFVQLPEDYRGLLGGPMIFANPNSEGQCEDIQPLTPQNFTTGILKGGCKLNPVIEVPQAEFAYRTRSSYNAPTWENPICFKSGKKQLRICPYDITKVFVMYVRNEKTYRYGYISQPDDTYLFDLNTSIQSEWGSNAFPYLYKGVLALYGAYSSDPTISNFSAVLNNVGIL